MLIQECKQVLQQEDHGCGYPRDSDVLKSYLIPYDLQINKEKYYQTVFYLVFSLVGLKVEAEVKINKSRIDAVIIDKDVYILEFKFNGDKDRALNQIKDKKYFEKYQGTDKEIYLFGVEFADRNVGEWIVASKG